MRGSGSGHIEAGAVRTGHRIGSAEGGAMIAAFVILVVIGLIATIAVAGFLRSVVADESRTEARLRSPAVPTVVYELPNGVDPAVVKVALARAGFTCMADEARATESLRVEC